MSYRVGVLCSLLALCACSRTEKAPVEQRRVKDVRIVDIISPPAHPGQYHGNRLKPVVSLENAGTETVESIRIGYYVSLRNNGSVQLPGPATTWLGSLSPGAGIQVELDEFGRPLDEGVHHIELFVNQIDGQSVGATPDRRQARVFSLIP